MEKKLEEKILQEVSQKFNLQKKDKINYKKFTTIYQNYSDRFTELEFANLLGINNVRYKKIVKETKKEAFVFVNQNLTQEEKEDYLRYLENKYQLYKGQEITLSFFIKMYEKVKIKMTEIEFASLLGIKKGTYVGLKEKTKENKNAKVIIFMNRKLNSEEEQRKISEIVQLHNLYKGQKIDYAFLKEMYEKVKTELTEIEFANLLGISGENLRNIRNTKDKARLFKNMKLNTETIEKIRKNIINKYEGKSIYYNKNTENKGEVDFLELYKPYRIYFTEKEFSELLGISEKNIWYTKNSKGNPIIKDIVKVKKVEEMKKEITEGKYYSKIEIENLCKKFDISLRDFIIYYINKGKFFYYSEYEKAIDNNQRLWIGTTKIENSDIEKYSEMYNRIVRTVINNINQKYGEYYLEEDMKSDMLIFIIYQCGDLVKNFQYDEKLMERMIWIRTRKYGQIKYIEEFKKSIKKVVLAEDKIPIKDTINDYEEKTNNDKNEMNEEKLIELFKNYLNQGYDKETIIENVSKTFNIKKSEMLEMIKKYLLEKGKVVQNKNGEYEIGEQ